MSPGAAVETTTGAVSPQPRVVDLAQVPVRALNAELHAPSAATSDP